MAAVAVSLMNFPIAHIQGGEVTELLMKAFARSNKIIHIHFPATKDAAERIIKMGEISDFIHQ